MTGGELKRMVEEDGLAGMTSNPAIFEKAIDETDDYKEPLKSGRFRGLDPKDIYEQLAVEDIQSAAAVLKPVYEETRGGDGFVSMEVSPHLARDTQGTIEEAKRLWAMIGRPNIMIKVPGTPEGIPAIEELTAQGINVNVTLLFGLEMYEQSAKAYIRGLRKLALKRDDLSRIASVASFFVSRIDKAVDKLIDEELAMAIEPKTVSALPNVRGKTAIANAKLAYARYQELFDAEEWRALEQRRARKQRLLWASTGTKDPQYSDVLYVEELIGRGTVNTMPPATFKAFKEHGRLRESLTEDLDGSRRIMETLQHAGISFKAVTDQLLLDAINLFSKPFDSLLAKLRGITK
jgi:transaldolase